MPDVIRLRTALLLALLLAVPGPMAGQDAKFGEATSVVVVEVPVQVLLDGKPVRGLTAQNFEVFDGKKRQQVTGFEVVDLAQPAATTGAGAPPPEVSIAGRRHFLLLFDFSNSDPATLLKARDAAKDLVAGLHPSDLVGVASYTPTRGPALVMGFTSDRSHVAVAIESLGLPEFAPKAIDPAGLVFGDLQGAQSAVSDSLGRGGSTGLREALEDLSRMSGKADREVQRNQVVAMSRGMSEMAKALATVQGRKHVVLLSEGFDSSLLFASEDRQEQSQQNQAIESGEIWKVDSDQRFGSTRTQSVLTDLLEEFKRADCSIQAVDIGGLRAGGDAAAGAASGRTNQAPGQDGLYAMAAGTGGELFRNFNDLSQAMGQVLENTSVSYVLAFQPDDLDFDGKFHRLKVELKNAPRGARLVHRPGYYAPKPASQMTPIEQRLETAEKVLGESGGPIAVSVLAAPFSTGNMLAYVPVVIEIDGATLLEGVSGDAVNAEIYAYGIAASGGVRDYFGQSLGLDLKKVRQGLAQGGLKFYGHLDLEPDDYTVRVLVRNGQSGRSSVAVVPLRVPDFQSAGPVLLPAFFPETPGRWILAREAAEQGGAQPEYPFVIKEESYIPAAKPVVRPGESARVALVAYNFGAGDIPIQSRILDRDGREVTGGRFAVHERTPAGPPGIARLRASFEAGSLAPGEYQLVVSATDPATGRRESSTAPFVVARGAASGR